jgi:hypothetical protein
MIYELIISSHIAFYFVIGKKNNNKNCIKKPIIMTKKKFEIKHIKIAI